MRSLTTIGYGVLALALVVWALADPRIRPVVLLLGLAVVAGVHALAAMDSRAGGSGRVVSERDIAAARSRYPDGSGY